MAFRDSLPSKQKSLAPFHRRTNSQNLDSDKALSSFLTHRRTHSNMPKDLRPSPVPKITPQLTAPLEEEPLTPDSLNSPVAAPEPSKKKSFVGLLEAAITYFNYESKTTIPTRDDTEDLMKEINALQKKQQELLYEKEELYSNYRDVRNALDEYKRQEENYLKHIESLQRYANELEDSLKKTKEDLELQKRKNLPREPNSRILRRVASFGKNSGSSIDTAKNDDKPSPRPINYKPITQRGFRNQQKKSSHYT